MSEQAGDYFYRNDNEAFNRAFDAAQPAPEGRWQQRDPGLWYFIDDGGMEWNIPSEVHDALNALEAEVASLRESLQGIAEIAQGALDAAQKVQP